MLANVPLNANGQATYTVTYKDDDPVSISVSFAATPPYLGSKSATLVERIKG